LVASYMAGMTTATAIAREHARTRTGQFGVQENTAPEESLDARAKLDRARQLTEDLLAENGLDGWRVRFDNAGRRLGVCRHSQKSSGLRRQRGAGRSDETAQSTIRHEVAHRRAGPGEGHGPVWKHIAARLGADPTATTDAPEVKDARARRLEALIV